jgi:glyoxylase-like metal-dependent hydrolase (beta-lactamase superfamily II)
VSAAGVAGGADAQKSRDQLVHWCNLAAAMTAAPVSITNAESVGKKKSQQMTTRRSFLTGTLCLAATSLARAEDFGAEGFPTQLELGMQPMTRIAKTVWVARLAPRLWLHTTTNVIAPGTYFPANGLILERENDSLLIDTTSQPESAATLLRWSRESLRKPIRQAVATHFHRDRTGGIPALDTAGIPTVAHALTLELARSHSLPVPSGTLDFVNGVTHLSKGCELFFPGPGHSRDNVVVWFPRQRVLHGGCLLKSVTSKDLGNLADAVVTDWADTIKRVQRRYPTPKKVIPGHGTISGDPLAWTLALCGKDAKRSASNPINPLL